MFRHGLAAVCAVFVLAGAPPGASGQPGATGPAYAHRAQSLLGLAANEAGESIRTHCICPECYEGMKDDAPAQTA